MTSHELCKYIVSNFVKKGPISWPKEIKIAQKLIKEWSGEEFWINTPKIELASLAFFITANGREHLTKAKKDLEVSKSFVIPDQKNIEILPNKIGEDAIFKPNKQTLKEFLNKK